MPESLTACVIVRDEEERLPGCLRSLAFCDEVVVVDGGSRDRTVEIARQAGASVVENPWPGFAAQRNVALDHAHGDWVLEVDADERVTPELQAEIRALLADPPHGLRMAAIPRREVFLGLALGMSVRYPRYVYRLFRRGAFRHDESRLVHEGLWPDGPTVPLQGELDHLLASTWQEALRDTLAYAKLEALQRSRPAAAEAVVGLALRPVAKLGYRLLLYGAWRDGWRGLAKVGLECVGDSLTAIFRLRNDTTGGIRGFGQTPPRRGPVRLVGVALRTAGSARLERWLVDAAQAGADVSLISPGRGGASVRCRPLRHATPGALVRALDAEEQVRPIDALVVAGRPERLLTRLAPRSLRGAVAALYPDVDPGEAIGRVESQTRGATRVASIL